MSATGAVHETATLMIPLGRSARPPPTGAGGAGGGADAEDAAGRSSKHASAYATVRARLLQLLGRWDVTLIAIGNGTGCKEAEGLVRDALHERAAAADGQQTPSAEVRCLIVDESGASVYSASALAGEELPLLDVSLRGAVSLARRVQEPQPAASHHRPPPRAGATTSSLPPSVTPACRSHNQQPPTIGHPSVSQPPVSHASRRHQPPSSRA